MQLQLWSLSEIIAHKFWGGVVCNNISPQHVLGPLISTTVTGLVAPRSHLDVTPCTGKSCSSGFASVKATLEAPKFLVTGIFEPSNLVSTKTHVLKQYDRFQGYSYRSSCGTVELPEMSWITKISVEPLWPREMEPFVLLACFPYFFQRETPAEWTTSWNWAFAAAKRLVKNGVKLVVKNSGRFRTSFPEERGTSKFHQKFHGIYHGDFHARFQEKISRRHFCKPCRDEIL